MGCKISSFTRKNLRQRDMEGGISPRHPAAGRQDICHAWTISDQEPANPLDAEIFFIASDGIRSIEEPICSRGNNRLLSRRVPSCLNSRVLSRWLVVVMSLLS